MHIDITLWIALMTALFWLGVSAVLFARVKRSILLGILGVALMASPYVLRKTVDCGAITGVHNESELRSALGGWL
jgi:hypothetical protein